MAASGRTPIVIAAVARAHGLRGAVRVKVFNEETEALDPGCKVRLVPAGGGAVRTMTVAHSQPEAVTWIVQFDEVRSREEADALRGAEVVVDREDLPPPDEGEFYHADLVGCSVVDAKGEPVGEVRDVRRYPSVDALAVHGPSGEMEIPLVEGIVLAIDLAARRITIDRDTLE